VSQSGFFWKTGWICKLWIRNASVSSFFLKLVPGNFFGNRISNTILSPAPGFSDPDPTPTPPHLLAERELSKYISFVLALRNRFFLTWIHEKIIVVRHDVLKTVNQSTYLFLFSLTTDAADPELDPNSKKPVPDLENYRLCVFFVRIRLHQLFISIFSKMSDLPSLFYGSEVRQYINRIFRKGSVNGFSLRLVSGNFLNPETGSLLLLYPAPVFPDPDPIPTPPHLLAEREPNQYILLYLSFRLELHATCYVLQTIIRRKL